LFEKGEKVKEFDDKSGGLLEILPMGIVEFDSDFKVIKTNENFSRIDVLPKERNTVGKSIFELAFVKKYNLESELKTLAEVPVERELESIETKTGIISIVLKAVPNFDEEGFAGGVLIIEDLRLAKTITPDASSLSEVVKALASWYDAVVLLHPEGRIALLELKKEKEKIFKKSAKHFREIFGKENENLFPKKSEKIFPESGEPMELKIKKGKDLFHMRMHSVKLETKKQEKRFLVLVSDITEEKEKEEALRLELEELKRFQTVSENLTDGFFVLDYEGKIIFWNSGAESIFGFQKSQVFNKFVSSILPQIDKKFFETIKNQLRKEGKWNSEFKLVTSGKEEFLETRMGRIGEETKFEIAVLVTVVTKRAEMERELKRSEELYRNIVTHSNDFICILDKEGKIIYANPSFRKSLDYDEKEIKGHKLFEFVDKTQVKKNEKELGKIFGKKPATAELPLRTKSGRVIFTLTKTNPIFGFDDELLYHNVIMVDITAQKESQRDMQLIRTVFEASIDGIIVIKERKIILANDAFAKMFGAKNIGEIIGSDPLDFCDSSSLSVMAKAIQKSENSPDESQRFEFKGIKKDGNVIFVENSLTSYRVDEEVYIVSILRDVTERKKALERLEQSERLYRNVVDNINDFLWSAEKVNGKLKQVFYTSAVVKMLGYKGEDFLQNKFLWFRIIHPHDRASVVSKLKSIFANKNKGNAELEYRVVNKFGNILWIRNKISIIRNKEGEIQEIVGLVSDVTLSRKAEEELKRSAEELRALNETKDRFLSIISHDLRTPFSSILGYTDLLLNDREMPEDKRVEYISFIQDSAKNMLALVNSLLDWTRLQTGRIKFEPKRINAKVLVNSSIRMLDGMAMRKNINLVANLEPEVFVHADENLLLQVFNNLISNAIKFTKPGGSVEISARADSKNHAIEFCVADTGVGIKKEDMDKLFRVDSKFTLEGTAGEKGSGLGLSLVYDIVKKHNGDIWVESEYGKGTKFFFTIPVSSTTILLVDDIQSDRILYTKLLKSVLPNYTVKNAPNGKAAFEAVKSVSPALVITEHEMPLMNGAELVKQIQLSDDIVNKPSVIVLSRKITDEAKETYRELGVTYVFQKPVDLDVFRLAIENSLKNAFGN
jgi:PAS domain S-box-containing protein